MLLLFAYRSTGQPKAICVLYFTPISILKKTHQNLPIWELTRGLSVYNLVQCGGFKLTVLATIVECRQLMLGRYAQNHLYLFS